MTFITTQKIGSYMGSNYNNYMRKTTYYSGFSTLLDLKKRAGKKKYTIHELIEIL